jgi:hypothetical protein
VRLVGDRQPVGCVVFGWHAARCGEAHGGGLDRMRFIASFLWATKPTARAPIQPSRPTNDSCHSCQLRECP